MPLLAALVLLWTRELAAVAAAARRRPNSKEMVLAAAPAVPAWPQNGNRPSGASEEGLEQAVRPGLAGPRPVALGVLVLVA